MNSSRFYASSPGPSPVSWKLFLGLSRTPHGVLDLATPAFAALLCLGGFPHYSVVLVGLITAFAGYTAVYALNDLVDCRVDRQRLARRQDGPDLFDLDSITVRHPVAQGLLPYRSAFLWCLTWAGIALAGAWWLNPMCAALFVASAILETVYCKLLRVTYLKVVPSAFVKASGGIAGALAVDPYPSFGFLAVLFLWLAAWEIGGQNVPNDVVDMDEDSLVAAKTTATVKGLRESVFISLTAAAMACFGSVAIYWFAGPGIGWVYPIGAALLSWKLLLEPARDVYYDPGVGTCAYLFNRAGYVPAGFLLVTALSIIIPVP